MNLSTNYDLVIQKKNWLLNPFCGWFHVGTSASWKQLAKVTAELRREPFMFASCHEQDLQLEARLL